jgi:hypothetical protein
MVTRESWYKQIFVQFELVKQFANKEVAFLEKQDGSIVDRKPKVIRCINAATIRYLQTNFDGFRFMQFPNFNIYFSLANYPGMPTFTFNPKKRSEQYAKWTGGDYKTYAQGYDWGIDIDAVTPQEAQSDALKVRTIFEEYKLPYSVKFSGSKGFHFLIQYRWLPQLPFETLVEMLAELTTAMKMIDNIPNIDDTIIDERRIIKAAYSWDRGKIALPLDDNQLLQFDPIFVDPNWVNAHIKVMNRGLLTRHTDQTEDDARQSFWKMARQFIEVKNYVPN